MCSQRRGIVWRSCAVLQCNRRSRALNFCQKHYLRFKKYGDPQTLKYYTESEDKRTHKSCCSCGQNLRIDEFYWLKNRYGHRTRASYCRRCCTIRVTEWRKSNPEKAKQVAKNWHSALKLEVFNHYGRRCACCGEEEMVFLAIDHIGGGGRKHRRKFEGIGLWRWLKNNGYPQGYRVLCHNCNWATAFGRTCPHTIRQQSAAD